MCRYNVVRIVGILLWQESDAFTRKQIHVGMLCKPHGWHYAVLHRHVPTSRLGVESRLGHIHDHIGW